MNRLVVSALVMAVCAAPAFAQTTEATIERAQDALGHADELIESTHAGVDRLDVLAGIVDELIEDADAAIEAGNAADAGISSCMPTASSKPPARRPRVSTR